MSGPSTLDVEALTRLNLKPSEILAVAFGQPITPIQCAEVQEWLAEWFDAHGMPVAGVLVLPPGSSVQAVHSTAAPGVSEQKIRDTVRKILRDDMRRAMPNQRLTTIRD